MKRDRGAIVRPVVTFALSGLAVLVLVAVAGAVALRSLSTSEAVRDAQEFTWQTLSSAFRVGTGQLIPDRFFWARETLAGK